MKRENLCSQILTYLQSLDSAKLSRITRYKLAEGFGIHMNYLSTLFKQETQVPLSKYLQKLKIQRAEELLLTRRDLNISEIARQIGIMKVEHFCKIFKENHGITPGQFRKINKT